MKYMGSKNRIAKFVLPIMIKEVNEKGITTWVEPFIGGANIKSVVLFDSEMNPLKKFISIREAERLSGVKRQLLKFSCKGRGKAAGCYFRFSEIDFTENENWMDFLKFRNYDYKPTDFIITKSDLLNLIHLPYKEILKSINIEYTESTRQKLMKIIKKYNLKRKVKSDNQ